MHSVCELLQASVLTRGLVHSDENETKFHKEGLHLASIWKWELLELGNALLGKLLSLYAFGEKNSPKSISKHCLCKIGRKQSV